MKTLRLSLIGCIVVFVAAVVLSPSIPVASSSPPVASPRIVLAEEFTGTWCPYCPGASGALERLEAKLGRDKLVVLGFHSGGRFGNPDSDARLAYYNISGIPTVIFNGLYRKVGGNQNPNDYSIDQSYNGLYAVSSSRSSPVEIAMTGLINMEDPTRYRADCEVTVTATDAIPTAPKVRFVIYEDDINYRAQNGETHFDWVVRDVLDEAPLTITEAGQQETFQRSVILNPQWNRQKLGLAVIVQRDGTRPEVLQAAHHQFE
jgi:thiol-disulfide isomerase/thioredoxin